MMHYAPVCAQGYKMDRLEAFDTLKAMIQSTLGPAARTDAERASDAHKRRGRTYNNLDPANDVRLAHGACSLAATAAKQ